jgi:Fe-S-cluster containining protein
VFSVDRERLDASALALTELRGDRHYMRFDDGRCVALAHEGDRWICKIYESRPDACRWLERGSALCRNILSSS